MLLKYFPVIFSVRINNQIFSVMTFETDVFLHFKEQFTVIVTHLEGHILSANRTAYADSLY
jgi:hypothetical protein